MSSNHSRCLFPVGLILRTKWFDGHQERGFRALQHHRLRRGLALPRDPGKGRGRPTDRSRGRHGLQEHCPGKSHCAELLLTSSFLSACLLIVFHAPHFRFFIGARTAHGTHIIANIIVDINPTCRHAKGLEQRC